MGLELLYQPGGASMSLMGFSNQFFVPALEFFARLLYCRPEVLTEEGMEQGINVIVERENEYKLLAGQSFIIIENPKSEAEIIEVGHYYPTFLATVISQESPRSLEYQCDYQTKELGDGGTLGFEVEIPSQRSRAFELRSTFHIWDGFQEGSWLTSLLREYHRFTEIQNQLIRLTIIRSPESIIEHQLSRLRRVVSSLIKFIPDLGKVLVWNPETVFTEIECEKVRRLILQAVPKPFQQFVENPEDFPRFGLWQDKLDIEFLFASDIPGFDESEDCDVSCRLEWVSLPAEARDREIADRSAYFLRTVREVLGYLPSSILEGGDGKAETMEVSIEDLPGVHLGVLSIEARQIAYYLNSLLPQQL